MCAVLKPKVERFDLAREMLERGGCLRVYEECIGIN